MKQLDPKAVWMFFFGYLMAILFLALVFIWIGFALFGSALPLDQIRGDADIPWIILFLIDFWWIILILLAIAGYVWSHFSWRLYRYELRDDGFRKEYGVIWKKYVTIPYERIQNVDIYRGLLGRILGLSDLEIQTAGMSAIVSRFSGIGGEGAEGRLPCVSREEAEKVRDELIRRARGSKNQGV